VAGIYQRPTNEARRPIPEN